MRVSHCFSLGQTHYLKYYKTFKFVPIFYVYYLIWAYCVVLMINTLFVITTM